MKISLRGRQAFWLQAGAAVLVLLVLLFAWVLPARRKAEAARRAWELRLVEFRALKAEAPRIPSAESLKGISGYRDWLGEQAALTEGFFADRAAVLEAAIAGQGEVSGFAFKDAYRQEVLKQRRRLEQRKGMMTVADLNGAFTTYPWETNPEAAPRPEEYLAVQRDFWAREYLFSTLYDSGVKVVGKLKVEKMSPLEGGFEGRMPISINVSLPPENVNKLLENLLVVSPMVTRKPIINLDRMTLQKDPGGKWVNLQLDGDILFLRRPGAAKPGGKP